MMALYWRLSEEILYDFSLGIVHIMVGPQIGILLYCDNIYIYIYIYIYILRQIC